MNSDSLKLSICLHIVVQLFDVWFVEWMNEWTDKVISIKIYSQTEIIPWVTTEELENENIMQNDANHNLESK